MFMEFDLPCWWIIRSTQSKAIECIQPCAMEWFNSVNVYSDHRWQQVIFYSVYLHFCEWTLMSEISCGSHENLHTFGPLWHNQFPYLHLSCELQTLATKYKISWWEKCYLLIKNQSAPLVFKLFMIIFYCVNLYNNLDPLLQKSCVDPINHILIVQKT